MNTPRCAPKFANNPKLIKLFNRNWLPLWSCGSSVGDIYYQFEKWKVWRFMGGM